MQTTQMPSAIFYFAPWAINYYHSFAETLIGMHIAACMRFKHCDASTLPGPRLFRTEIDWGEWDWSETLPALQEMAQCISPEGILHMNDTKVWEQVYGHAVYIMHMQKGCLRVRADSLVLVPGMLIASCLHLNAKKAHC